MKTFNCKLAGLNLHRNRNRRLPVKSVKVYKYSRHVPPRGPQGATSSSSLLFKFKLNYNFAHMSTITFILTSQYRHRWRLYLTYQTCCIYVSCSIYSSQGSAFGSFLRHKWDPQCSKVFTIFTLLSSSGMSLSYLLYSTVIFVTIPTCDVFWWWRWCCNCL